MALGGGTFTAQNKVLAGAYINFISAARANANLSERGFATMPLELDWGVDGEVFEVTVDNFKENSLKLFGYDYTHEKMKDLRELFKHLNTLYAYRLNSGVQASNTFATAKYSGVRGNDLKVVIQANVDDETKFDVALYLDTKLIDKQVVKTAAELIDNDFVTWKTTATLAVTASTPLTGGTNVEADVEVHQAYLDAIESYSFNIIGVCTTDNSVKTLYANFTKRMREDVGAKFQLVVHRHPADFEGVISVKNNVTDAGASVASLVYWTTGLEAACPVNKSCLNAKYDGEYTVDCKYTQYDLTQCIKNGEFTFHNVGKEAHVLADINSLTTLTDVKGEVFQENQTIRVIDQLANDTATLFNDKYLGKIPNDASGRVSLWTDLVKIREALQKIRAIENFKDADIEVVQGEQKKAVVANETITVVNAMAQLYMTTIVG